jgi:hypothetical protein
MTIISETGSDRSASGTLIASWNQKKGLLRERNSPSFSILFLFLFRSVRHIRIPVQIPDLQVLVS